MRDVAEVADVSLKTVSRVVNRETGVSDDLRERVEAAVHRLGYELDARARTLRTRIQTTRTIGVVQVDAANPFSSLVHRGIEDVARAHGFLLLAGSSDEDPAREADLVRSFVERRVDGLILFPTDHAGTTLAPQTARGLPVVCVDRRAEDVTCDTVLSDNHFGLRRATEHLLSRGHRRIAYLGDSLAIFTARERLAGFREALAAVGLAEDRALEHADLRDPEASQRVAARLLELDDPPSAFVSGQNLVTIGIVRELHRQGLQHEVALVGFDDVQFASELRPGITTVNQDPYEIGRRGARFLFERLDGRDDPPREVVLEVVLVPRGSGEIPAPTR